MATINKKLLYAANPVLEMPIPECRQFDLSTEEGRQSQKRQERYFERFQEFRFVPAFIPIEIVVSGYWDELGPFPQTILGLLINNNRPALQMVDELGCIIPATEERRAWAKKYLRKCAEKPRLRWASSLRVNSGVGWCAEELMRELFEPEEVVTGEGSESPTHVDTGENVACNPDAIPVNGIEEVATQSVSEGEPRKMKKNALIAMLVSEGYKNVEAAFRHSGGIGGLSEAAKHKSHGYWYIDKAHAWFEQEKANTNHVKAANNPDPLNTWHGLSGIITHKLKG